METDTKGDTIYISLTDVNGNIILRDVRNDSTLQNKIYTGHRYDNVTQLTYAHARYLDTRTHTFTTVDPLYYQLSSAQLYNPQLMNAYSYANNNPVVNTDPTGLLPSISSMYNYVSGKANAAIATVSNTWNSVVSNAKSYFSGGNSTPVPTKTTAPSYLNNISLKSTGNSNISIPSGNTAMSTPNSGSGGGAGLTTLSLAVSVTPILGNVYSGLNAVSGIDVITMRSLTNTERTLEGGFALIPGGGVGKVMGKGAEKVLGKEVMSKSTSFFQGTSYTDKVLGQMKNTDDAMHSFPEIVRNFESSGRVEALIGGDGTEYSKLIIEGFYRGRKGAFTFMKDEFGVINHRLFEF